MNYSNATRHTGGIYAMTCWQVVPQNQDFADSTIVFWDWQEAVHFALMIRHYVKIRCAVKAKPMDDELASWLPLRFPGAVRVR